MVAVADGGGLHPRRVGARGPLGHREADPDVTVHQRHEVPLLLLLGAVLDQRQHRRVLRAHAVQRPRAEVRERPADLDLHDRVGEVAEPHPAVLDRDERAPQPGGAGLGLQLADDVEERPGADLRLGRQDHVVDERATRARIARTSSGSSKSIMVADTATVDSNCQPSYW